MEECCPWLDAPGLLSLSVFETGLSVGPGSVILYSWVLETTLSRGDHGLPQMPEEFMA